MLTLARPGERLALVERLVDDASRVVRIEHGLTEPDPRRAILVMTELQAETVALAPPGPNVERARHWLAEVLNVLRDAERG
jgi:hypothetical protein